MAQENKPTEAAQRHERIEDALCAAQKRFEKIQKLTIGRDGNREYKYAELDAVLDAILPALNYEGIALNWRSEWDSKDQQLTIFAVLSYGEQRLEAGVPVYADAKMKSLGSGITYAKRYSAQLVTGTTSEEDQDSEGANPQQALYRDARNPPRETKTTDPLTPWLVRIAQLETTQAAVEFANNALAHEPLKRDPRLLMRIVLALEQEATKREQAGDWTPEDCQQLADHLHSIKGNELARRQMDATFARAK